MTNLDENDTNLFDITFIGAGPVALYGMYYAGLRQMKVKAIDMLEEVGGGLMALYPEKYIYDVAGFPKVLAKELVALLKKQASQYPHTICQGERVNRIERKPDGTIVLGTDRGEHYTKTVVICVGLGAYIPKRLDIPNVRELEGHGIFYFVRRLNDFKGKSILVVGGGDAAFDYSMMLEPVAASIVHIHRNDFFSAHESSVRNVMNSSVRMKYPFWEVKKIEGEDWVEKVTIIQSRTGEEEVLKVDAVLFNLGFLTNLGPIAEWGVTIEKNSIAVDRRMRTSLEGVYAAGDIVSYDGKLKLISTGCGEAAIAVNNAKHEINPKAKVNPGHSTDRHEMVMRKVSRKSPEKKDE